MLTLEKIRISKLDAKTLKKRLAKIKPIVSKQGIKYFIAAVDPVNRSYVWDPKFTTKVGPVEEIGQITTYHTYGYYGFFKPSVAEVLAQIPEQYLHADAFEIVGSPDTADDLNWDSDATNQGFHVARTALYKLLK